MRTGICPPAEQPDFDETSPYYAETVDAITANAPVVAEFLDAPYDIYVGWPKSLPKPTVSMVITEHTCTVLDSESDPASPTFLIEQPDNESGDLPQLAEVLFEACRRAADTELQRDHEASSLITSNAPTESVTAAVCLADGSQIAGWQSLASILAREAQDSYLSFKPEKPVMSWQHIPSGKISGFEQAAVSLATFQFAAPDGSNRSARTLQVYVLI